MTTIAKHMTAATKKSKRLEDDLADRKTPTKSSQIDVVRVRVADVKVSSRWRSINESKLKHLVESINSIGIQNPIHVRISNGKIRLVAGRHRLEAAKKLGWTRIDAIPMPESKLDRQLWHYSENLDRTDLTALEYAEAVAQHAKLVAKKAARDANSGGRQPHDKGISKAAKALGTSRDDVRRSKTIAAISSEAKKAAVEARLDDNGKALLKVAKVATPEAQIRKVHELAKPNRASKPELSNKERKQLKRLKRRFNDAVERHQTWMQAGKIVRDRFVAHIRKLTPTG
jgi:ParB family transcriptional regulator, chromosome partitioning protein